MSNLNVYACSLGICGTSDGRRSYVKVSDNSFGNIIAKEFGLDFINQSHPGASNYDIFKKLLRDFHTFKPDDVVLVQWASIDRAYNIDGYTTMPQNVNDTDKVIANIAEVYYKYMYEETQSFAQVAGYVYYLNTVLNARFYFSMVDGPSLISKVDKTLYQNLVSNKNYISFDNKDFHDFLKTFNDDSIYYPCHHPSELGHKKIAELYIKALTNE